MSIRSRRGTFALIALALGWALVMQSLGWAQTSYYAFVKALGDGTPTIDAYHWETRDKSYIGGHFYSVKAPGLPLALTPPYLVLRAAGAERLGAAAAAAAERGGATQWSYQALNVHAYGYDRANAIRTKRRLEREAPLVWTLGLFGTVLPGFALLMLVRRRVDLVEPGYGALTAVTLGGATLIMPFAVNLFGHVLAALLSFAAFTLAWHERDRQAPRILLVLLAGLLSGLAVTTEYPLAITGAIVGLYAVLRPGTLGAGRVAVARRAGAYTGGVILGVLPLLVYNLVAFGSVATLSYKNAVNQQGRTGHETLGLNNGGFFGIGMPAPRQAADLLVSPRGVLVLIPVVVMGFVGTWLLHRRGRRAEALVITAVVVGYFLYDTGYWLPMGGGSPGPRFLIATLPFLAVGIGCAWRRLPGPTLALAVPSAVTMIVATLTYPLIGPGQSSLWMDRLRQASFQHTLVSVLGGDNGWLAVAPVLAAFAVAAVLAVSSAPALSWRGASVSTAAALGGWALLAGVIAPAFGEAEISGAVVGPTGRIIHGGHASLVWAAVALTAVILALFGRRSAHPVDDERARDPALEAQTVDPSRPPRRPRRAPQPVAVQHHAADPETA
jgi:hypothetical protein